MQSIFGNNMHNVFGDFENRAQQRQKQKQEIDALLESETTTVGDLFSMDNQEKQDEIMSQLRWGNKKVLNFFNEKRCFELIEYLIEMPPQDCTHDRGHKFPFLANQVFIDGGEGVVPIIEQFFYSKTILKVDEKKKNDKWEIEQIIKQGFKKISKSKKQIQEVKLEQQEFIPQENKIIDDDEDDFKVIMNNVPGSIEQDSSDEEIKPANLSDEFLEVGMVIPMHDDDENEDFDKVDKQDQNAGIMENIANMVDMLNNPQQNTDQKYEVMMQKLNNPNVKKSFETKVENDDDDEIFIVHEEEDENQDSLFAEGAFQSFNEGDAAEPVMAKTTSTESAENPFTDNLANSVALPLTQKLDVQIDENYLAQYEPEEKEGQDSKNMHAEKQLRRRNKAKTQNISIHQFDAKTQQSIQETVQQERQRIMNADLLSKSVSNPQINKIMQEEKKGEKSQVPKEFNLATSVMLVEDHVVKQKDRAAAADTSPEDKEIVSSAEVEVVPLSPEKDDFNDRAGEDDELIEVVQDIHDEEESMSLTLKLKEFEIQKEEEVEIEVEVELDEDDDNILRKSAPGNAIPIATDSVPKYEFEEIEDHQEEQLSIEIVEKEEENTRKQDYKLITAFFAFLDVEPTQDENGDSLNPTLCGYFCRVLQVMIQHQPQEINKYIQSTDYKILDKLMKFIDNESICEIFIKLLNTISDQSNQSLPVGIVNVQNSLQQSGQSSESNPKHSIEDAPNAVQKKIQEIALNLLENCLNDDSDILMKMGAIEVLESLLQKKWCYQVLTTKKSFEIMTIRLVSDFDETKKFMYILMKNLVDFYEKHEGLIKRLNFDNFEDDELMNSHSGSFMDGKKSKNSKKHNQEVFKDIQESDLFHFFKAVINEISAAEIESKFEQIQEGKGKRLGTYFMAVIEFLEVASTTFSGFKFDLNHVIIEKELFIYLFDICEYFQNSDCLIQKVFKIIENIFKAKNDDVSEMVRYLLEDTQLIPFLMKHGPRVTMKEEVAKVEEISPEKKKDHNGTKSPEQSGEFLQESSQIKVNKKKLQLQCNNPSGLQSQCKLISNLINECYKKDKKEKSLDKLKNFNSNSGIHNSGQQSGEQSKSSLFEIEPTDEEQQIQRVSKMIVLKLRDNDEWFTYIQTCIEPIIELEKGKLCQNDETGSENDTNSHGNLFDEDFMRSDFAENGDSQNQEESQEKQKTDNNEEAAKDGDEEDHQKFFKKMQQCFSSNKTIGSKNKGIDYIEENERDSKSAAMSIQSEVNDNLRASLSDLANFSPKDNLSDNLGLEKRERSCSKDKFDLPPLPDMDDNKDLMELDDPETNDFKNDNYRSNDDFSHLAAIGESDSNDFLKDEMNQDLDELKNTDFNADIENEGLNQGNLNNLSDDDDFHIDQDKLFTFDSGDILKEVKAAVQEEQMFSNLKAHSQIMENDNQDDKLQFNEFQEFNSIFDRIADLDKLSDDSNDDDEFGLDRAIGSIDVEYTESEPDHKNSQKSEVGITQSIDEIMKDFPGVIVKPNNFMIDLDLEMEKEEEKETEQILKTPSNFKQNNFMKNLQLDMDNLDEPEQLLTTPRVMDHQSISKSEYIPSKSSVSLQNTQNSYQDNVYWDLKNSLIENYKLEDLLEDYD